MAMNLNQLRSLGFNDSYNIPFTSQYKVVCSQCNALCINGYPTHETGCSNSKYECKGCSNIVEVYNSYCRDCL